MKNLIARTLWMKDLISIIHPIKWMSPVVYMAEAALHSVALDTAVWLTILSETIVLGWLVIAALAGG